MIVRERHPLSTVDSALSPTLPLRKWRFKLNRLGLPPASADFQSIRRLLAWETRAARLFLWRVARRAEQAWQTVWKGSIRNSWNIITIGMTMIPSLKQRHNSRCFPGGTDHTPDYLTHKPDLEKTNTSIRQMKQHSHFTGGWRWITSIYGQLIGFAIANCGWITINHLWYIVMIHQPSTLKLSHTQRTTVACKPYKTVWR